jgi:hypothetical protein
MTTAQRTIPKVLLAGVLCLLLVFSPTVVKWSKEQYYMSMLSSGNRDEVLTACEKLALMKSTKCLHILIELIRREKLEQGLLGESRTVGGDGKVLSSTDFISLTPIAYCVFQFGEDALPVVSQHIEKEEKRLEATAVSRSGSRRRNWLTQPLSALFGLTENDNETMRVFSTLLAIKIGVESNGTCVVEKVDYSTEK